MICDNNIDFWQLPSFKNDFGKMDSNTYKDLQAKIIAGKGEIITMAGGFLSLEISDQSKEGKGQKWLVIYAVYLSFNLVVLSNKFPVDNEGFIINHQSESEYCKISQFRKKLTTDQQKALKLKKDSLDRIVKKKFKLK